MPHLHDPASICKDEFVTLLNVFSSFKAPKILKSGWEDCKRVSYHGEQSFYSSRCVSCRTISLPSVNGLSCKLTEIAPFIGESLFTRFASLTYAYHYLMTLIK